MSLTTKQVQQFLDSILEDKKFSSKSIDYTIVEWIMNALDIDYDEFRTKFFEGKTPEKKVTFFDSVMFVIENERKSHQWDGEKQYLVDPTEFPTKYSLAIINDLKGAPLYIVAASKADFLYKLITYIRSLGINPEDLFDEENFKDVDQPLTVEKIWKINGFGEESVPPVMPKIIGSVDIETEKKADAKKSSKKEELSNEEEEKPAKKTPAKKPAKKEKESSDSEGEEKPAKKTPIKKPAKKEEESSDSEGEEKPAKKTPIKKPAKKEESSDSEGEEKKKPKKKPETKKGTKKTTKKGGDDSEVFYEKGDLILKKYSTGKSMALYGLPKDDEDTREAIKELGAKWNSNLEDGKGWIIGFGKDEKKKVKDVIKILKKID